MGFALLGELYFLEIDVINSIKFKKSGTSKVFAL